MFSFLRFFVVNCLFLLVGFSQRVMMEANPVSIQLVQFLLVYAMLLGVGSAAVRLLYFVFASVCKSDDLPV